MDIKLVKPSLEDWLLVKNIWEDENTMEDVGGIILLSKENYNNWYKRIFEIEQSIHKYYLITDNESNNCYGEVSFHRYDKKNKKAELNIKVKKDYRNKGIGTKALDILLKYYFTEWGGEIMEDRLRIENINGYKSLLGYGFIEIKRDKEEILVEIRKGDWIKKRSLTPASTLFALC
jgi:RimJ/RimL family protein N-acetyltransferase